MWNYSINMLNENYININYEKQKYDHYFEKQSKWIWPKVLQESMLTIRLTLIKDEFLHKELGYSPTPNSEWQDRILWNPQALTDEILSPSINLGNAITRGLRSVPLKLRLKLWVSHSHEMTKLFVQEELRICVCIWTFICIEECF